MEGRGHRAASSQVGRAAKGSKAHHLDPQGTVAKASLSSGLRQ